MTRGGGPRLARCIVRVTGQLVPASARASWLREWEAELDARWDALAERSALTTRARLDLMLRACGSVMDAITYGRGGWTMDGYGHDVRIAARGLLRRPGFSGVIVVTLALGIGATTAIFGVARDVLLRPFPYPDPDRVVSVQELQEGRVGFEGNVTYPNIHDLGLAAKSFEAIGAARWWIPALEDERGSVVLDGATITANFFDILGTDAGEGRFFRADEQGEGRESLVVLSHELWVDHFGADPAVVGSDIRLSGDAYRVIGVTAADFEDPWLLDGPGGGGPQVWRTVASPPSEWPRSGRSWRGIARLRPDVSLEAAQSELDAIFARLAEEHPDANRSYSVRITPLRSLLAGPARPALYTLLGSVGLLLLIACANLANLLLGRALDRRGEIALHRALGASRWRMLHRALAEAAMLALAGGGLGVLLAVRLGDVAQRLGAMLPRPVTGDVDGPVLLFALAVTTATGLLFGLAPALHATRGDEALPGRDEARGGTLGLAGNRLRRALVVGEIALTTALLVGSGLLTRSFQRLGAVDLGLRTEGVVGLELHGAAWSELDAGAAQAQWDAVLEAVRAAPGVDDAGAIDYLPLAGSYSCDGIARADQPPPGPEGRCAEVRVVLPGALETLGLPLVRGRGIDRRDGPDQPAVAVIDETMASTFWPGEDPLGARFAVHGRTHEVVGIVGDMRHFGPGGVVRPMVYLHAPQEGWNGIARGLAVVARGADAPRLVAPIRGAIAGVNASIAIGDVNTLESLLARTVAGPRFRTLLMVAFAGAALLLAVLGITGVMSYSVARRTRELGVRLALGARPEEVLGLVLREGVRLVVLGVGAGLIGSLAVAGALDGLLFEVSARDPRVYLGVALLLATTATAACWVPARRASRVDPVAALTSE